MNEESHYVRRYENRHFEDTVEIWCPNLDETEAHFNTKYLRYCPMCGDGIREELGHYDYER